MAEKLVMNPDSKEWAYGRRNVKTLRLYPLAIGQMTKMSDLFSDALDTAINAKHDASDAQFIGVMVNILQTKLRPILALVADLDESAPELDEVLETATTLQITELAEYIWDTNFGRVVKNVESLVKAAIPAQQ